jgi:phosphatidylglycerophosphate synthase
MSKTCDIGAAVQRPWDARIARRLIAPLARSWVAPNHLTTVRLLVGLAAAAAFVPGTYGYSNLAAWLLVLSNFLDHTDGELARMSGKISRFGHIYDLASDATVTILLFMAVGVGVGATSGNALKFPAIGAIAGIAVATIFYIRMRIEELAGKAATRQVSVAGFEIEDVLYLMPLVTLCNGLVPLLVAASIFAPLFAVWTLFGYRDAVRRTQPPAGGAARDVVALDDGALAAHLRQFDSKPLRRQFVEQGAFLYLEKFLPPEITAELVRAVSALGGSVNRNYLPGHKQGGSVSRHAIDAMAPFIAGLYRSAALMSWLGDLTDERLQVSPADDPHAYALYFYTRSGDHIGWHYDTSYYRGRRFTLLLGVIDHSSSRLDYQLHTRVPGVATVAGSLRYPPGGLVFFDGDKLRHRVTPLGEGEMRVSLTFEYVTDPRMHAWWRLISNLKDAVAYFGLRQVFRKGGVTGVPSERA